MNEVMEYMNYRQYKSALDNEMQQSVEGFVRIGYLLRLAEETNILEESGYTNVNEFAKAEYGLDKTQVSRFIHIHERFGEPGQATLKDQYRGYGVAKLGLMLTLPDVVNEELSPEFSKSEIQAIKDEVDAEKSVTDIEVLLEGEKAEQQAMNNIEKVVHQLGKDEPELYVSLHKAQKDPWKEAEAIQEILAPAGEMMYSIRIQGVGRLMLAVKDVGQDITLTNIRTGEKEFYTWNELIDAVEKNTNMGVEPEESWERVYGESFPKKEVTVESEKKPEPRKQTKVMKAKPEKKEEKKPEVAPVQPITEEPQEEQLPGQMEVADYPELLPETEEDVENTVCEVVEGEVVEVEEIPAEEQGEIRQRRIYLEQLLKEELDQIERCIAIQEYGAARKSIFAVNNVIDKLEALPKSTEEDDENE